MQLSVKERLVLLNLLPTQETYDNMLIVRDLMGELGFSEADHKELGLVEKDGDVTWDDEDASYAFRCRKENSDIPEGKKCYKCRRWYCGRHENIQQCPDCGKTMVDT